GPGRPCRLRSPSRRQHGMQAASLRARATPSIQPRKRGRKRHRARPARGGVRAYDATALVTRIIGERARRTRAREVGVGSLVMNNAADAAIYGYGIRRVGTKHDIAVGRQRPVKTARAARGVEVIPSAER